METPTYGIDKDLAQKQKIKYDRNIEKEHAAQKWIENVVGRKFTSTFSSSLKSGVILCELINKIKPEIVNGYYKNPSNKWRERENIELFLNACRILGILDSMLFTTIDLHEEKDLGKVVEGIYALGSISQKHSTFSGPFLGPKLSSINTHINFHPNNTPSLQNMGDSRQMKNVRSQFSTGFTYHTSNNDGVVKGKKLFCPECGTKRSSSTHRCLNCCLKL